MTTLWFGFPACHRENFVNCRYLEAGGPCQTPAHQKSGPLIEGSLGEEVPSKKKFTPVNPRKRFFRPEAQAEEMED